MSHWSYLPFLLVWALPVVAFQWLVGARYLWRERHAWPWVVLGLTVYFTLADAVAINAGIWFFDTHSLVGLYVGPVPIEETLFYLLTALMVVQGFVLLWAAASERDKLLSYWRTRLSRLRHSPRPDFASVASDEPPAPSASSASDRDAQPVG